MYNKDELKNLKADFWRMLENRTRRLPKQRGEKKYWILDRTEIKGLDLRFELGRERLRVALEINHTDEERRLGLYQKLLACKTIFEETFGEPLIWDFAYEKELGEQVCRVYVEMLADFHHQEQWTEMHKFMISKMMKMEEAFLEVKDFLKYQEYEGIR